jgi:hypothetical protein
VNFGTISQFLGHSGLQTTMRYARADLNLKRQALAQVFPDVLGAPKAGAKPGATRLNSGALPFAPIEDAIVQNPASAAD